MNDVLLSTLKLSRMTAISVDAPVFCTPEGTPYKNFRTAFERAIAKAGIVDFTFHYLRHTHLTTDHKQRAVRLLEAVAEKVPAIFTTGQVRQRSSRS